MIALNWTPRMLTRFKKIWTLFALCAPVTCWVWMTSAFAATDQVSHSVAVVVVEPHLSIEEQEGDFELTFSEHDAGSVSDAKTITYNIKGNSFVATALTGVVSARVTDPAQNIALEGDVGTYVNVGSEGNIELSEAASGFQEIGSDLTALADKPATAGPQARVLHGTLPVTWRARAEKDLVAGSYQAGLVVTIKDS